MNTTSRFEKIILKATIGITFPLRKMPGYYRLVRFIYPYYRTRHQKGIWVEKNYLDQQYDLRIKLFSKDLIDHKILFTGFYETDTYEILKKHIKKGDSVIEAGANSGTETLLLSKLVGPTGRIHAFEPVSHVYQKLESNCKLNNLQNVSLHQLALGDKTGEIDFYISDLTHPNQGMGSVLNSDKKTKITVKQDSIDEFIIKNKINSFQFLKMDVQGGETGVLNGAKNAIRRYMPLIFLEAAKEWSDLDELMDLLRQMNYKVHLINQSGGLTHLNSPAPGNWLALPGEKLTDKL